MAPVWWTVSSGRSSLARTGSAGCAAAVELAPLAVSWMSSSTSAILARICSHSTHSKLSAKLDTAGVVLPPVVLARHEPRSWNHLEHSEQRRSSSPVSPHAAQRRACTPERCAPSPPPPLPPDPSMAAALDASLASSSGCSWARRLG
eukprot:scaffold64466_cov24-Tisochrysis_lutea.AAC.2